MNVNLQVSVSQNSMDSRRIGGPRKARTCRTAIVILAERTDRQALTVSSQPSSGVRRVQAFSAFLCMLTSAMPLLRVTCLNVYRLPFQDKRFHRRAPSALVLCIHPLSSSRPGVPSHHLAPRLTVRRWMQILFLSVIVNIHC